MNRNRWTGWVAGVVILVAVVVLLVAILAGPPETLVPQAAGAPTKRANVDHRNHGPAIADPGTVPAAGSPAEPRTDRRAPDATAVIHGTVVDTTTGLPVSGIRVGGERLDDDGDDPDALLRPGLSVVTDSEGRYGLAGLAPGLWMVTVGSTPYGAWSDSLFDPGPAGSRWIGERLEVSVEARARTQLDLQVVRPACAQFVVEFDGVEPDRPIRLLLRKLGGDYAHIDTFVGVSADEAWTASLGNLQPGRYALTVHDPQARKWHRELELPPGTTTAVPILLETGWALRVLAEGESGEPAPPVRVTVMAIDRAHPRRVSWNVLQEGCATLGGFRPGQTVRLIPHDAAFEVITTTLEQPVTDVRLIRRAEPLIVTVIRADGQPVGTGRAELVPLDPPGRPIHGRIIDGTLRLERANGRYRVRVAERFGWNQSELLSDGFDWQASSAGPARMQLPAEPARCSVQATVLDAEGEPVAEASVLLSSDRGQYTPGHCQQAQTDADGRVELAVPAGRYQVRASAGDRRFGVLPVHDIDADCAIVIPVSPWNSFAVTVVNEDGTPFVDTARLHALPVGSGNHESFDAATRLEDGTGTGTLRLCVGRWQLSLISCSRRLTVEPAVLDVAVTAPDGGENKLTLVVRNGHLAGPVIGAATLDGAPASGVVFYALDGTRVCTAAVGPDGKFRTPRLPRGDYMVSVWGGAGHRDEVYGVQPLCVSAVPQFVELAPPVRQGLVIAAVRPGAMADAGVRAGDCLVALDGIQVRGRKDLIAILMTWALAHPPVEVAAPITFVRDGEELTRTLRFRSDDALATTIE